MEDIFETLKERARRLWDERGLLDQKVIIRARPLTVEEAIGNPEAKDFPLQKGKERLHAGRIYGQPWPGIY